MPFLLAPICGTGGEPLPPAPKYLRWAVWALERIHFDRLIGNGFLFGVVMTEAWSLGNEIIIYLVKNPRHGPDWGNWFSDVAGLLTAYLVYRRLLAREARYLSKTPRNA